MVLISNFFQVDNLSVSTFDEEELQYFEEAETMERTPLAAGNESGLFS